jgi:putative oxidoreductase
MIPDRYAPQTYALMRIVFGLILLMYGLQKFGMLGGQAVPLGTWPLGIAGPIEVVIGTLLILGLFTKPAAFIGSGEMAVAYFYRHLPMGPTPVQNMGQAAVLLCFGLLYIATRGAGIWSFEGARRH